MTEGIVPEDFDLNEARHQPSTTDPETEPRCPECGSRALLPRAERSTNTADADYRCNKCGDYLQEMDLVTKTEYELSQLPPSGKLVYKVLEESDKPMTQRSIAKETRLPSSTVSKALDQLTESDLVSRNTTPDDSTSRYRYTLESNI